jgi:REP element-mobilizing transposase RayT
MISLGRIALLRRNITENPMPTGDDSEHHHRRSPRLRGYDYSQAGAYFVTICTQQRLSCLVQLVEGVTRLSPAGQMVQATWDAMPQHYSGLDLDAFVIMPDHVHGIVVVRGEQSGLALPDVVQRFKSLTTARYRHHVTISGWIPFPGRLWQRSY